MWGLYSGLEVTNLECKYMCILNLEIWSYFCSHQMPFEIKINYRLFVPKMFFYLFRALQSLDICTVCLRQNYSSNKHSQQSRSGVHQKAQETSGSSRLQCTQEHSNFNRKSRGVFNFMLDFFHRPKLFLQIT